MGMMSNDIPPSKRSFEDHKTQTQDKSNKEIQKTSTRKTKKIRKRTRRRIISTRIGGKTWKK